MLPKIRNYRQREKKAGAFTPKKGKKPHLILQKWLDTLATYDVISRNHRNDSKGYVRDMHTATRNGRCG